MPVRRKFDFLINGKGYMLMRGPAKGRAWYRTGVPDTTSRRSPTDVQYGNLPSQIEHVEVWDDWSGGFGQAYRRYGENTYHWAEGFDARFPRQLVHAQNFKTLNLGSLSSAMLQIHDAPVPSWWPGETTERAGAGVVVIKGVTAQGILRPNGQPVDGQFAFDVVATTNTTGQFFGHGRPALFGSYFYYPFAHASWAFWQSAANNLVAGQAAPDLYNAQGFAVAGNRLWRYFGFNFHSFRLSSVAANPMATADWSATLSVGNGYLSVSDMIAHEDQVFCGMPDGLYAGDQSGTFVNVLGELAGQVNNDNCRDLTVHESKVIAPTTAGLFAYEQNGLIAMASQILPTALSNRSPIKGRIRATKSFAGWLYAGLYTGSQSYLLAGQQRQDGWVWHPLHRFAHICNPHRLHFDSVSVASSGMPINPRLWVLTEASIDTGGTSPVYFQQIPPFNGNPVASDPSFSPNYTLTANIYLGNVDWGAPSTPKVYRSVEVWAAELSAGAAWCNVYYSVDNEATRRLLGSANISPKSILYFPSGAGSFVTGQSIELSLESRTANAGISPVYRAIVLRGVLRPNSVDEITAVVRIADNMRDREGAPMRTAAAMISELRSVATASSLHELIDLTGATSYVAVMPPVIEQDVYQQGSEEPEIAATIKMVVEDFS